MDQLIISLQFNAFDVDISSSGRCWDHLTIVDGNGTTLMEKSCGSFLPAGITSTTNTVDLIFITSGVNSDPGWNVSWSAVTPGECLDNVEKLRFSFLKLIMVGVFSKVSAIWAENLILLAPSGALVFILVYYRSAEQPLFLQRVGALLPIYIH